MGSFIFKVKHLRQLVAISLGGFPERLSSSISVLQILMGEEDWQDVSGSLCCHVQPLRFINKPVSFVCLKAQM